MAPQPPGPAIGRRVAMRRLEKRWNQAQLAEAAGTSRQYVRKLERGEIARPGDDKLMPIARALDCTLEQLRGGSAIEQREALARAQWRYLDAQAPDLPPATRDQMRRLIRDDALRMSDQDLAIWSERMRELGFGPDADHEEDCPGCGCEQQAG